MDSDFSSLTTIVLDSQAFGHQDEAVDRFLPDCLHGLASRAESLIHQCHVADPAFDADDAVQEALLHFWRAATGSRLAAPETEEELARLLAYKVKQEVLNERAREETYKRSGSSLCCIAEGFDAIDPNCMSPEQEAIAMEKVESSLRRLHDGDPLLRAIATMKTDGFNHREIAAHLKLPLSGVDYRLRLIRAILAHGNSEPD